MKRKDFLKEIRSESEADLKKKIVTLSEELMKLRFRKVTGQLQQSHRLKELRRQIATIKTQLSAKNKDGLKAKEAAQA